MADRFIELKVKKLIKDIQRNHDNNLYEEVMPDDRMTCKICGGVYSRKNRGNHNKSKRHIKKVDIIYTTVNDLLN